ncbi:unnamed protein product (mitochondrion) [Plasmodiophora brassicae]|uniref:Uncharacterized protein n=1 Tax=Plasmodiophora brassicae TaxID=37360 RepID=A0A3P3Y3Z1_PLABS|nr:unnamed protein product [Plasmodiophora brassicae]
MHTPKSFIAASSYNSRFSLISIPIDSTDRVVIGWSSQYGTFRTNIFGRVTTSRSRISNSISVPSSGTALHRLSVGRDDMKRSMIR